MLSIMDVRLYLVRPAFKYCRIWSRASENLIIGTGLVESEFKYLAQIEGPALSPWQIEPPTFTWLIHRLSTDRDLMLRVLKYLGMATLPSDPHQLINNMALACILARLKYWYNPAPLPGADDIEGLARYWAKIYNTRNNEKDIKRFINRYDRYGEHNAE